MEINLLKTNQHETEFCTIHVYSYIWPVMAESEEDMHEKLVHGSMKWNWKLKE